MNVSRRILAAALTPLWFLVAARGTAAAPPAPDPPPNVILIVADDLGYGDVGCYGQRRIGTPRIDRMAREGIRFTRFYSGAPVCAPSRAVLLTGLHTGHVSVDHNESPNTPLAPSERTFAEALTASGYHTVLSGKWGLGGATPSMDFGGSVPGVKLPAGGGDRILSSTAHSLPTRKGFAESLSVVDQAYAHQHFPEFVWEGERPTTIPQNAGRPQASRPVYAQDLFTSRALEAIRAADGRRPLCMFVSYLLPHRELVNPPGANPYSAEPWPPREKAYAAMVSRLDADVGRLLDAVDANPAISRNTLVVFTSDNGPAQADGHDPAFFASSGGLRGRKSSVYEGGIRVPGIVRWTGHSPAGVTCDTPCGFVDVTATLAELAGAPRPEGDGVSLVPLLRGGKALRRGTPFVWFNAEKGGGPDGGGTRAAVMEGKWKFVLKTTGEGELYDLDADPAESRNLAGSNPDRVGAYYRTAADQLRQPLPPLKETGR